MIRLPYNWSPRDYQSPLLAKMDGGVKRAIQVWHRRGGKDLTDFNYTIKETQKRVGAYWHVFPTYKQGRKAIWEGVTKEGKRYISYIPKEIVKSVNKQEMVFEFKNGSIWRIVGGDNIDSLVGAGPVGVVLSEWSIQNPSTWDYIQPMLLENGGWALFNGTPRGENHFYDMVEMAKQNPQWYVDVRTIEDTGVVTQEQIEELRREGKREEIIQQEYYCSFEGSIEGAYYGDMMKKAKADGRICSVPVDDNALVKTVWDLGISDSMSIIFYQQIGKEIHIVDYVEDNNKSLAHYIGLLEQKGYNYGKHYAPHDIKQRELTTGKTRLELAESMGVKFEVVPNMPVIDGINAGRGIFSRLWIDEKKCKQLINCLKQYRKEYDEKLNRFKDSPLHDWASHGADAYRYLAVSLEDKKAQRMSHFVAGTEFRL